MSDAESSLQRSRAASGGSVEPSNPAVLIRDRLRRPENATETRYELRDPVAEVTYRSKAFDEIVARAETIGSSRFIAIDGSEGRTVFGKSDGEWRPQVARPVEAPQRQPTAPSLGPVPLTKVVGLTGPAAQPATSPIPEVLKNDARDERAIAVARIEAALLERYLIKRAPVLAGDVTIGRTEYRFRGDASRVAFTESTFKLATDTNSPSIARSMVDVAEARDWRGVRVSGHEDFKRMVWLEASVRGVKAIGYEPTPADLKILQREQESRRRNRIEPMPGAVATAERGSSGRGGGGRKTVLAAIEAVLLAQRVPEARREAVLSAAAEKLAERLREGRVPKVRVYDPAAPSRRVAPAPIRSAEQARERASPAR